MAGSFNVHNHAGVLKIVIMNGNILQGYFTLNLEIFYCVQHAF